MMKTIVKSVLSISLLFFHFLFTSANALAQKETRQMDVTNFQSVKIAVPGKISIAQGEGYSLKIDASKRVFHKLIVEVNNGSLIIRYPSDSSPLWDDSIEARITLPMLECISVAGSAKVEAETPISSDYLNLSLAGSGTIIISNLELSSLKASLAGSGTIVLAGNGAASQALINVAGSGDAVIHGIVFDEANVSIAGSGNASLEAKSSLKARVAGSGDVVYKGTPLVDAKVVGSGRVKSR